MLLIKTKLGASNIHGIGLFSVEFIPEGTKVWEYHPNFDQVFTQAQLDHCDPLLQEFLKTYTYRYKGKYHLCADDTRFFNHSKASNCVDVYVNSPDADHPGSYTIAIKDIHPGEELTCNYSSFGYDEEDHRFNLMFCNES